ncbi:MAG: pectate lyase, partial [Duncaniella sp.]|nr:pectate lyase [Duncaniella sp.]
TDRIDSTLTYMVENNITFLDHNYGLWYERRRDDHERIRRRDGDVWAPFYEQPFARSGEGTAWDGLSKYDLTRPNAWYWNRLSQFAEKGADLGKLLFNEHYFQHNILEAGAHWVDSPWRSANNINSTDFPEPVPFAGDKRIFVADMFYDVNHPVRRDLHRNFIRMNLDNFADNPNVVHLISAEFTGPQHFVEFWLDTIDEWEKETGKKANVALSTTKDVQDAILANPKYRDIVDIIDIRYWHYKTDGLYAPEGGKNLAPRQHARKMKVGKVTFKEAYKAVSEYRGKYPDKAVTYYAQNYPDMAWAVFMAGGSLAGIPVKDTEFLKDAAGMEIIESASDNFKLLGNQDGCIIYSQGANSIPLELTSG